MKYFEKLIKLIYFLILFSVILSVLALAYGVFLAS